MASDLFDPHLFRSKSPGTKVSYNSYRQTPHKGNLLRVLTRLGFSILLWEEHKQILMEFVARMITYWHSPSRSRRAYDGTGEEDGSIKNQLLPPCC